MKNILKFFLILAIAVSAMQVSAQKTQKLGHINFAQLYEMMPGQDSIKTAFNAYQEQLQSQFQAMQAEYETKLNDYQSNQATMSNIIKQTKEKEILDLQRRIQDFQQTAQEDLQAKEAELTAPIIDKARTAVKDVAKENGYNFIFNSTEGLLLYTESADDIMPLVKKKLGLK
ncbi:MAG: OmpH family outer membrane protein [Lentimicrobiaceae bacterium]|nr:OmpH family outer membrane protein [Lentimicrobiaceae bacterium]MCO5265121.1 OmpH family outer membrane protein [Lentimicrobium sp.]HPG33260.1 OmpH family outer membrane protein [Lentimicrobium sp.]